MLQTAPHPSERRPARDRSDFEEVAVPGEASPGLAERDARTMLHVEPFCLSGTFSSSLPSRRSAPSGSHTRPSMPYFDHNATTPLSPVARETWLKASDEHWHNPSSPYRDAAKAKIRLDGARERLAEFLGAEPEHLIFNSGATEAAHSIFEYLALRLGSSAKIAVSSIEHPSVIAAAERSFSGRILPLGTGRDGRVPPDRVKDLLANRAVQAVVLMAANNETGVLQPWQEVASLCRDHGVPFVCDASQWLGKLPASGLGRVDWVFGAGHKFGGPKGVGFLKIAADADAFSAQPGGAQENGHRGGTENIPSIWAMVAALADAEQRKVFLESERLLWRQEFERNLLMSLPGCEVVGAAAERLWNTVALIAPHAENTRWVTKLDKLGFQVSTGSACATGKQGPSHVLSAMSYSAEEARRVIRISAGWETTREEWTQLAAALQTVAAELKATAVDVVKP
jgi:cysteine desulfurase